MRPFVLLLCLLPIAFSYPVHSANENDEVLEKFLSKYNSAIMKKLLADERAMNLVKEMTLTALDVSLPQNERENIIVEILMSSGPNADREIAMMTAKLMVSLVEPWEQTIADIGMEYVRKTLDMVLGKEFIEGTNEERKMMMVELSEEYEKDMEKKGTLQKNKGSFKDLFSVGFLKV